MSKNQGTVFAVCKKSEPDVPKPRVDEINLIEDFGVEGDYHAGKTVRHRYLAKKDPLQPNHRQVLITDTTLFADVAQQGITLEPGWLGENLVLDGVSVMALPVGTQIAIGDAVLELTEVRDPCNQLNACHPGILKAVVIKEENEVRFNSGMLARVLSSGPVRPGDAVRVL